MSHTENFLRRAHRSMGQFGLDALRFCRAVRGLPPYLRDYFEFKRRLQQSGNGFRMGAVYPILHDRFDQAGSATGHYFHQDLLVANRIFHNNPARHVDVGSRIDGFVAHVASFREIECLDIRPAISNIPNLTFRQVDLMSPEFDLIDYCDSVSSLHAVEHFGLGRYGDPIDASGHIHGLDNIYKMLKPAGMFYFSVPIGPQRIEFNAHRVFSLRYLLDLLQPRYAVDSFSYVDDRHRLYTDVPLSPENVENNFSCNYGCGIFELTKSEL